MDALLPPVAASLLADERAFLLQLQDLLNAAGVDPDLARRVKELTEHLEELFLVVVVGEFNAGKSSFLNALFGERLLEEGPVPTTDKITLLRYGTDRQERPISPFIVERRLPNDLLKHINLVDTPGTNSIIREHQAITEDFVPRSDLVLFVTSYDRPLSDSEQQFLTYIRDAWGKRLVFVLNKADLARGDEADLKQVVEHIRAGCQALMGFEPRIFPVSSDLALAAKTAGSEADRETLWQQSRFEPLETFVTKVLTGPEQMGLKLTAPLDSSEQVLKTLDDQLASRKDLLVSDEEKLVLFETQLTEKRDELKEGYARYLAEVDNVLLEMERRGVQFLEDNIRISKLNLIRDRALFKEEFSRQVVQNHERRIEDHMNEAVDWLLRNLLSIWNWTANHFAEQASKGIARGSEAHNRFEYDRAGVLDGMMRQARRRIEGYDLNEEARRILENSRNAAALFLGTEAVAAGIGVVVTVLIVAAGVDVTGGFIASGALALLGLFFLPRQRKQAISEFRERIDGLRSDMKKTLSDQFEHEIDTSIDRLQEWVTPYAKLVHDERQRLDQQLAERSQLQTALADLRKRVRAAFKSVQIEDTSEA